MKETSTKLPNFLLIGAGKSGTTSLFNYLKQHPEVYMSPVKEPNFFALEGQQKITGYDAADPHGFHHYPWAVTQLEDYKALFADVQHEKAIGEASTMYQYMPKAPENILKYTPNAKLVAIFRNPADRLYSRYLHLARENRTPTKHFEDCLERGNLWWVKNDLIQEGFYYSHMKRYFNLFPREQIKVFLYEDLRDQPEETIAELYRFLGVDEAFKPSTDVQYNVSGIVKNKLADTFIGQQSIVRKGIEAIAPGVVQSARNSPLLQKAVTSLRKRNLSRPPMLAATRSRLIGEVYEKEIRAFQRLIGRDLTHWMHTG